VDNALNLETSQAYQTQLARERDRLRILLEVNNVLVNSLEFPELFRGIVSTLQRVIHHDYTSLALLDPVTGLLRIHALDFPGRQGLLKPEMVIPRDGSPAGRAIGEGRTVVVRGNEFDAYNSEVIKLLRAEGLQTILCIPLTNRGRTFGSLNLAGRRVDAFTDTDIEVVQQVAAQVAIAVENAVAFKEIDALKEKLSEEKLYLEEEIRNAFNFEEIVGESAAIRRVLAQVELVAPAGTTVLLQGETGTGKEVIARAVHNLSPRRERTFVKINCAAIPSGLLEAELFGHERGAFTGAAARRTGRFELAHGGTIFLDEVAELPLELQPKLLRVLQEGEFEPVGSSQTRKVDVRVIAATNRDLSAEVAAGRFREDLYYRLHVFPISVPPLRERGSDVELLAQNFLERNCKRMGKAPLELTSDCLRRLRSYHWPGNVRELENVIERAVIIARENHLNLRDVLPLHNIPQAAERRCTEAAAPVPVVRTKGELREIERETLIRALEEAKWKVAGTQGAAAKLGIPPSTLTSRMKALQIKRPS